LGIPISSRAVWGKKPTRIPTRISREEILHGLQQRVSARFMPGFQQRVSSKEQAKIPSSHVQQGALVFNCLPSLPKPNTAQHIEQSRKQSEKKVKTEPKAKQEVVFIKVLTRLQNNPNKVYAIFSTSQIGTITKAGTSTETGNNISRKVPARDPARFRQ
jgi:hypothetical protein